MTVLEFIRQHPAQAVDVISSKGCEHVTPMRSMALARDRPEDEEVIAPGREWERGDSNADVSGRSAAGTRPKTRKNKQR